MNRRKERERSGNKREYVFAFFCFSMGWRAQGVLSMDCVGQVVLTLWFKEAGAFYRLSLRYFRKGSTNAVYFDAVSFYMYTSCSYCFKFNTCTHGWVPFFIQNVIFLIAKQQKNICNICKQAIVKIRLVIYFSLKSKD